MTEITLSSLKTEDAHATLLRALTEERSWIRIHAAEALIALGEPAMARDLFLRELPVLEKSPARVGAWRVLAATAGAASERAEYVGKIETVFLQENSADRLQALESLCKLKVAPTGELLQAITAMGEGPERDRPLSCWAQHLAGDGTAVDRLAGLLRSTDAILRLRAAYALRWLHPVSDRIRSHLATAVDAEPADSEARPYVLSAAIAVAADPARLDAWLKEAARIRDTGTGAARFEICQALLGRVSRADAPSFRSLLTHANADARIGAAWVILQIP